MSSSDWQRKQTAVACTFQHCCLHSEHRGCAVCGSRSVLCLCEDVRGFQAGAFPVLAGVTHPLLSIHQGRVTGQLWSRAPSLTSHVPLLKGDALGKEQPDKAWHLKLVPLPWQGCWSWWLRCSWWRSGLGDCEQLNQGVLEISCPISWEFTPHGQGYWIGKANVFTWTSRMVISSRPELLELLGARIWIVAIMTGFAHGYHASGVKRKLPAEGQLPSCPACQSC